MNDEAVAFSSAIDQTRMLRERTVSVSELLGIYRERISQYNPSLNAIVVDLLESAAEQAAEIDRRPTEQRPAPLFGLPMTIKESIEVEGLPATGGVLEHAGRLSPGSAPHYESLRDAGMTLMGKTNIPHSCADWQSDSPVYGRTNNPWSLDRSPGGSSGGSAAAVSIAMTPLDVGTDIGGSVRIPAAFCGVYGLRPSETALPRYGDFPGSLLPNPSVVMSVFGPLSRFADDLELGLDIMSRADVGEDVAWRIEIPPARHAQLTELRVAMLGDISWLPLSSDVRAAMETVRGALERAGARVSVIDPEDLFAGSWEHHLTYLRLVCSIMGWGMSDQERNEFVEVIAQGRLMLRDAVDDAFNAAPSDFMTWHVLREQQRQRFRWFFRDWDVLVTPLTLRSAFPHQTYGRAIFDLFMRSVEIDGTAVPYDLQLVPPALSTLSGQPSVAFPAGLGRDGLPIGLQAIGPYLEDRTPIRFASLIAEEIGGFTAPDGYGAPG